MQATEARIKAAWAIRDVEPTPLVAQLTPRLTGVCSFERTADGVARLASAWRTIAIEPPDDRALLARLLPAIDGDTSLAQLAERLEVAPERVCEVSTQLLGFGVIEAARGEPLDAVTFDRHLTSVALARFAELEREIGLLATIAGPDGHARLLRGWLVEVWHFVSSAPETIAPAIMSAPTELGRLMLSENLATEYWHGRWLREGLACADLAPAELAAARPLPATRAVSTSLQTLAARDFWAYLAANNLHENPPELTPGDLAGFWDGLVATRRLPDAALAPFRDHDLEDARLAHGQLAAPLLAEKGTVDVAEQDRIREAAFAHVHTLAEWHRQILRFYGAANGPPVFRAT